MEVIAILASLAFLAAIAGVIYPFKPFGKRRNALFTLIGCFVLLGVVAPEPDGNESVTASAASTPVEGKFLNVPSDANAKYFVTSVDKRTDGMIEISTRREGSSGISFAIRLVQCEPLRFGYIAESDTEADLVRNPSPNLTKVVSGSISDVVAKHACMRQAEPAPDQAKVDQETEKQQRIAADKERFRVNQEKEAAEYVSALDREIAAIPSVSAKSYIGSVDKINTGMLVIGAWALLYEQGGSLALSDGQEAKRQKFRSLVSRKQGEMFPALRDAYGPAMRRQLWEADGSARTIGSGYRTVEFVAAVFAANANIAKVHRDINENLKMLRFTRAQYKWIKEASEYSYYDLEVPTDSELVAWNTNGTHRVLN